MAKKLHDHLIKPLNVGKITRETAKHGQVAFTRVPGVGAQTVWLNGRDHLEGMNLSFTWGIHNGLGDWHTGRGLHVHPYPEVHFFVGLDTANINYLGAEIECCLGEEMELYTFSEPTVVVIPAGLPHGQTVTRRIFSTRGFGFYLAALSPTFRTSWLDKPTESGSTGKYAHLVKPLKSGIVTERGKFNSSRFTPEEQARREQRGKSNEMILGPGNADHLAWMYGKDLEGLDVNMDWGFFSKPGLWHRGVGAHVHAVDEVLVFVGTDPANMNSLGAEIEIDMGKEHERHLVNKPSVIICPAGIAHAPIVTRWVDRPFAFFSINLAGQSEMKFID
ncbi:MAG: hypothetical protein MUO19_04760 [Dehalococcoidales bacterium]|nr:hypothetical protein [Dehalococcoidales bacterium]